MNLLKDLLFTRGNVAWDVVRTCILASVALYWGGVYYMMITKGVYDPLTVAAGVGTLFSASAAWLHWRQKSEGGPDGGN